MEDVTKKQTTFNFFNIYVGGSNANHIFRINIHFGFFTFYILLKLKYKDFVVVYPMFIDKFKGSNSLVGY